MVSRFLLETIYIDKTNTIIILLNKFVLSSVAEGTKKRFNIQSVNFPEKEMVLVSKWKSARFQRIQTRRYFKKLAVWRNMIVLWILSTFSLSRYIFHKVFKRIISFVGSTKVSIFETEICSRCPHKWIQHYQLIFDNVKGFIRKPAKELCVIFSWNGIAKILVCKIHKNEKKK